MRRRLAGEGVSSTTGLVLGPYSKTFALEVPVCATFCSHGGRFRSQASAG